MLKLFVVQCIFVVLACAKECRPGQDCGLKCCTVPEGDVLCRARCLGLSCELDADCDGGCCVNSKCSSCLPKSLVTAPTTILETTESNIGVNDGEIAKCSRFNNHCASKCCVDGECVDSSRCTPKEAPRRRGGGGGRRISRGGGGSYSGSDSSGSGVGGWPTWARTLLIVGVVLIGIIIFIVIVYHIFKYGGVF